MHTSSATTYIDPNSSQHVILGENSPGYTADGEIISSQTVSSKTRTVETITVSARSTEYEYDLFYLSYAVAVRVAQQIVPHLKKTTINH